MKTLCRFPHSVILPLVLFALSLFCLKAEAASEYKPILTVSVSSVNGILNAGEKIAEITDTSDYFAIVRFGLAMTQGIDPNREFGFVILSNGEEETYEDVLPVFILPVIDLMQIPMIPEMLEDAKSPSDNVYIIENPGEGKNLHIEQKPGWVLITFEGGSEKIPGDPTDLLDKVEARDIIIANWDVQNTPKKVIDSIIELLMETAVEAGDDSANENLETLKEQLETIRKECVSIGFSFGLIPDSGDIYFDGSVEAVAGSKLLEDIEYYKNAKTTFSGFFLKEKSVFSFALAGRMRSEEVKPLVDQLNEFFQGVVGHIEDEELDEAELALAKKLLEQIREFLNSTLEMKEIDLAGSLRNDGVLLAAIKIAEGKKLSAAIASYLDFAKKIGKSDDFGEIEKIYIPDYAKFGDYQLSSLIIPVELLSSLPANFEDKELCIYIALSDNALCIAAGTEREAENVLKKAIAESKEPTPVPQPQAVFSLMELGNLLKAFAEDDDTLGELADDLSKTGPDAKITISTDFEKKNTSSSQLIITAPAIRYFVEKGIEGFQKGFMQGGGFDIEIEEDDPDVEDFIF